MTASRLACASGAAWYGPGAMTALPLGSTRSLPEAVPRSATPAIDREQRFTAMFEEHHDGIWRALRRLGVRDAQVDDATQQVFLVASRRLDDIRAGGERHYLYGVALRVASEHRRRDPAHRLVGAEDALDSVVDPTSAADEQLIAAQERAILDRVLAAMPEDLRQVIVLVELEEMTVSDVASILDLPFGTAASRLRRARESFSDNARRVRARLARGAR